MSSINTTLAASFVADWQNVDGVQDAGYAFSAVRAHRATPAPTAPASGVKIRRCNPTQNELALSASGAGIEANDCIFVVWANTLRSGGAADGALIEPAGDDVLQTATDGNYRILWWKRTADGAQYRCYCRKSVL